MRTPLLETERLLLVPPTADKAQLCFERWCSDDRVTKYLRWSSHQSVEDTIQWLTQEEKDTDSDKMYQWFFVRKEDGYIFGSGGIFFNEAENCFEMGYTTMYDMWNKGYTTEAAKRFLDFAIEELGEKQFVACHAKANPASGAVMKKCGFVYEKDGYNEKFDKSYGYETSVYRFRVK